MKLRVFSGYGREEEPSREVGEVISFFFLPIFVCLMHEA